MHIQVSFIYSKVQNKGSVTQPRVVQYVESIGACTPEDALTANKRGGEMSFEQAIKTAMEMETIIRDLYANAYETCKDPAGRRFFATLRDDEQYHHDYLSERLQEFERDGEIQHPDIILNIPSAAEIESCIKDAERNLAVEDRGVLQQMLSNALKVEVRTSEFYKSMVGQSDGTTRQMFARFLEIEEAHIAAVQSELDFVMNTGYWFDIKEFDME